MVIGYFIFEKEKIDYSNLWLINKKKIVLDF